MPFSDSPDEEVSIRQQNKATIPLFAGVKLPDVLSKVMATNANESPNLPRRASIQSPPKPGEMTILAQRIGNIHLETPAPAKMDIVPTSVVKPARLNFDIDSNIDDKENIDHTTSSGKKALTPSPRNGSAYSGNTSKASSTASSPLAWAVPAKLGERIWTALRTPPPRSPASHSPSPANSGAVPVNKRLSSARRTSPRTRTYTQAECDAAIRAAVAETEKRHKEISDSEYSNQLRNAVAEAEIKQKEALQSEFDVAMENAIKEAEQRVQDALRAEHSEALQKAVSEAEETQRAICKAEYNAALYIAVDAELQKQREAQRTDFDASVQQASAAKEEELLSQLKEAEAALEKVTHEAERSVTEIAMQLDEAKKSNAELTESHAAKIQAMEKEHEENIKSLKSTCEELTKAVDMLREETLAREKNETMAVEQNNELREALRGLQAWSDDLKANVDKKLKKAYENVMEREAELKRLRYSLEQTKEKMANEEKKVEEMTSRVSSIDVLYTKAQTDLARSQGAVSKQTEEIEKMKTESVQLRSELDTNSKMMASMEKEMQKLKQDSEFAGVSARKVLELESDLARQKDQCFEYYNELQAKSRECDDLYKTCDEVVGKIEEFDSERRALKEEVKRLRRERDHLSAI